MSECVEIQKQLHVFVDGECDEGDVLSIEKHLSGCAACRIQVERLYTLKDRMRAVLPVKAPPALKARILDTLQPAPPRRRLLTRVGIPALVTLGLGVILLNLSLPWGPSPVIEASVERHTLDLPVEIPGPNPEQVSLWFRGKVAFPVRVPRLPGDTHLLGGRLSAVKEGLAAQLTYERRGHKITILAFDPQEVPFTSPLPTFAPPTVRMKNREVYVSTSNGYQVVLFQDQGVGYAITADIDEELTDIVAAGWPH